MNALAADIITDAEMADVSTPVAASTAEGAEFDAPLNTLRRWKHNVRKPGSGNIAILKASLLNHGQLHPLLVLPGKAGTWEVVAGGGRFDAFTLLRQEKKILPTYPVRVKRITTEMAREISLAENLVRQSLNPVDEYLAYARIIKEGACAQEVADRFGVSLAHIERRLKLAGLSPKLLELRREGQISDEQVKALTLSDSHKEQEAAWFDHPESYNRTPSALRSRLTREQIDAANDRWSLFVGVNAYEAAGGRVNRDLFAQDGTAGYWLDAPILARLVDQKLAALADTVKAEGWSWVEAHNEKDYVSVHQFRRIDREEVGLNHEDEQEFNTLWAEKEAFEDPERGELSGEDERRLEEIETRLDALEEKRCVWTPAQMALAGVIIALNSMGEPLVTRGLLKPDVRLPPQRRELEDADGEVMEDDQEEGEREGSGDGAKKPDLSAALVLDLSAQRTAALRAAMLDRPDIALISVVYALMAPVFYGRNHDTALEIGVNTSELALKKYAADVEDGKGHKAVAARIGDWQARVPYAHHEAWGWLLEQGQETVMELLALCTACTVNATQDKYDDPMGGRLTHVNDLAATLRFDMTNWWEATAAGYFMRVSREQILEAVREQDGSAVYGMMGMKKTPLAIEAGRRMAGTGWLPRMLRSKPNANAEPETLDEQTDDQTDAQDRGELEF